MTPYPLAPAPLGPRGEVPAACDVAVVGASLGGLLTALFLARAGADVVVLEAETEAGGGAEGRDVGFVELGVVEHPHRTLRALGDRADHLLAWTDRGKAVLDEEGLLSEHGLAWIASRPGEEADLDASRDALRARGRPATRESAAAIAARTHTKGLGGGLFLPDEALVASDAFPTLVADVRAAGGTVCGRARVQAIDDAGSDGLRLSGKDFATRAELVVLAAGIGTAELDESMAGRLNSTREQLLCTAPLPARHGAHRAGQGWMRWRQHADGRLVVGGARWASPHMGIGETAPEVEPRIQERLDAFVHSHFGPATITHRWALCFAGTPDGLPLIGRLPGDARRMVICGLGPTPLALAAAGARAIAHGLLTGESDDNPLFSPRRLVRWRRA